MAHVSVGDRVCALDGSRDGKLVDIDGTTGYVLQANGVEIEFPLSRLKPYEPPPPAQSRTLSGPLRDTALSPAQQALLASVPPPILAAIAKSYVSDEKAGIARTPFETLPPSKQLDVIRIHLPTLPQRLIASQMKLVLAFQALSKPKR